VDKKELWVALSALTVAASGADSAAGRERAGVAGTVNPSVKGQPQGDKTRVLFVGSEGMLISDYNRHQLLPEDKYVNFTRPDPFIPDSIGHHREWTEACKTGGATTCNFDYSGALTEAALLCNVALRTGKKIAWDAPNLKAVGCPEADPLIRREYREGWTL